MKVNQYPTLASFASAAALISQTNTLYLLFSGTGLMALALQGLFPFSSLLSVWFKLVLEFRKNPRLLRRKAQGTLRKRGHMCKSHKMEKGVVICQLLSRTWTREA